MNEQSHIAAGLNAPIAGGRGAIGRLPLYGRLRAARSGAFVRPFAFFMSGIAAASGIYWFGLAAPIYTSDAQIGVRGRQALTISPLIAALSGATSGIPESTAATSFVQSTGMLQKLEASQKLRAQYSRFRLDFLNHLPDHASNHQFLSFYDRMVDVTLDPISNIITLHVRAFSPKEAQDTANAILHLSGDYVAQLSSQMMNESTTAAQGDVNAARAEAVKAHGATAAFQGKSRTLDVGAYGTAASGQVMSLEASITQLRAQLASLRTYSTAKSPQVAQVQAQINQLEGQKASLQAKLTGQQDGTVNNQLGQYTSLTLAQTYADQRLVAAQAALDQAKSVAEQRQLFVVPITQPTLPDEPTPRRWWGFFTVLAVSACLYTIGRLTLASIRDHQV